MNKINSMHRKAGSSSHLHPESFPSLTSPIKSDTNRETKGNFFNRIPSPLISIHPLLVHMVGIDVYPNSHLSFPSSHKLFILKHDENNTKITSKVLLLTRQWGGFSG